MTKLTWDSVGDRRFETGVDRGVLYPPEGSGVVWNGLVNVTQSSSGGGVTPYYLDGVKYYNSSEPEEFEARLEAFTYPDEFEQCDGASFTSTGLGFDQQERKTFGLSYRTILGNDLEETNFGYRVHIVYNALASPSERSYSTIGADPEALTFSWDITTTPVIIPNRLPTSHIIIDTIKADQSELIRELEDILYGTSTLPPSLPTPSQLIELFGKWEGLSIISNNATGMNRLVAFGEYDDVSGSIDKGLYTRGSNTRLREISETPGFYRLV